ncbi:hypothetical protein QTP88_016847 [Uroleucon formosanum]
MNFDLPGMVLEDVDTISPLNNFSSWLGVEFSKEKLDKFVDYFGLLISLFRNESMTNDCKL